MGNMPIIGKTLPENGKIYKVLFYLLIMEYEVNPTEKVYLAFYNSKKKAMYFNEIREKTKMSISSLQNAILKLEKAGEVSKIKETGHIFYSLKDKEEITLNFTKFDIKKLNSLNRDVKIPVKELTEQINNISFVMLFGSTSKGEEKKSSDIDILLVSHYFENERLNDLYQQEIKKEIEKIKKGVNAKSLYPISIIIVNEREFKERKDYLLDEAKKTGFCIYNHELYYKEVLKNEN